MAYQIIWTAEAETDFLGIVKYLEENWSQQSAEKFIAHAYKQLTKLSVMPSIAKPTTQQSIYIFKLDRKNALFFTVDNEHLILLSIYPYKKDITRSKYY